MPRCRELTERGARTLATADNASLVSLVDEVADIAGEDLSSMTVVAGHGWKMESVLADFYNRHLQLKLKVRALSLAAGALVWHFVLYPLAGVRRLAVAPAPAAQVSFAGGRNP